jgi:hypothetical protein
VRYGGKMMKLVDVLDALDALKPSTLLTTSEAAIFLRTSVTKMERLRRDGGGPTYSQGGGAKAVGTNQTCLYEKADLIAWVRGNKVSSSHEAMIRKGQAFATIFDLAELDAFYLDPVGNVESMVVENVLGTVVERVGDWDIQWMTSVEAASRRWTDPAKHAEFAKGVQAVLSQALQAIQSGLESTEMASFIDEAPSKPAKPIG